MTGTGARPGSGPDSEQAPSQDGIVQLRWVAAAVRIIDAHRQTGHPACQPSLEPTF